MQEGRSVGGGVEWKKLSPVPLPLPLHSLFPSPPLLLLLDLIHQTSHRLPAIIAQKGREDRVMSSPLSVSAPPPSPPSPPRPWQDRPAWPWPGPSPRTSPLSSPAFLFSCPAISPLPDAALPRESLAPSPPPQPTSNTRLGVSLFAQQEPRGHGRKASAAHPAIARKWVDERNQVGFFCAATVFLSDDRIRPKPPSPYHITQPLSTHPRLASPVCTLLSHPMFPMTTIVPNYIGDESCTY